MNILFNLIFMFIYIYVALIIGVPGATNNLIQNKFLLFGGIFIYQLIINLITKLVRPRFPNSSMSSIVKNSIFSSIMAIVGYSIYIDLLLMNVITDMENNKFISSAIISLIITLIIGSTKIAELIINNDFI
jgi:hypothetical protein